MENRTPAALRQDTIYECAFEVRFEGHESGAELMPGVMYAALKNQFERSTSLPFAQLPAQLREQDSHLAYQPVHLLIGPNFRLLLGKRVMVLSSPRPYPGWGAIQPRIIECIEALLRTELTGRIERFSLKYTNVLALGRDENDLSQLQLKLELNGFPLQGAGTVVKAEIALNGCQNIVQIATGTNITIRTPQLVEQVSGVLFDVDTIYMGPFSDFPAELPQLLELAHNTEKQVFFGLLTPESLEKLGPTWNQ